MGRTIDLRTGKEEALSVCPSCNSVRIDEDNGREYWISHETQRGTCEMLITEYKGRIEDVYCSPCLKKERKVVMAG